MRFGDLLTEAGIHVPLAAGTLADGLRILLESLGVGPDEAARLADDLCGAAGERILRPSPGTAIALVASERPPAGALGVSPSPMAGPKQAPRVLIVIRVAPPLRSGGEGLARLAEVVGTPAVEERILSAASAEELRGIRRLMGVTVSGIPKVRDALTPLSYRVYPDTPVEEVIDLMARKGLAAVPVVGEGLQVLGVISAGEALRQALQRSHAADSEARALTARDVMSRSIMCVTEDQDLDDAAQILVSRDVAQLPVVREGEIVGFLSRTEVLRSLFGK